MCGGFGFFLLVSFCCCVFYFVFVYFKKKIESSLCFLTATNIWKNLLMEFSKGLFFSSLIHMCLELSLDSSCGSSLPIQVQLYFKFLLRLALKKVICVCIIFCTTYEKQYFHAPKQESEVYFLETELYLPVKKLPSLSFYLYIYFSLVSVFEFALRFFKNYYFVFCLS